MTSLLVKHADEIAEAMAKSLDSEEFNKIFKAAAAVENEQDDKDFESFENSETSECMSSDCAEFKMAAEFTLNHLVKIADALDNNGFSVLAEIIDETMEKVAKKKSKYKAFEGKGEKPPKGAEHKAPKEWWAKMEDEISKKNPDYSKKRVREIVGDIWDNELSDAKRKAIYKKYGKTKDPNK